jgi:hypothetical protein
MNASPDTPGARLVTILASDPDPGRVDRARMGRGRNPADTEPRPEVPPEDIEATRAELDELRRRMTRKSA